MKRSDFIKTLALLPFISKTMEAKALNITQSQLAIIWCLCNTNVSSVILGASNITQLKENLESINLIENIDSKIIEKI